MEFDPFANIPAALKKPGYHKLSGGFVFPESEVEHLAGGRYIYYPGSVVLKHTNQVVDHVASSVYGRRPLYR